MRWPADLSPLLNPLTSLGCALRRRALASKLRTAIAMLTNRTLAAAFAGWHEAAAYRAATRRTLAACLARLQQQAVWSAWASWRALVGERRLEQQRLAAVVQHWRQAALAKAWQVGGCSARRAGDRLEGC